MAQQQKEMSSMIPTIESICDDLKSGHMTIAEAIKWLQTHELLEGECHS